MSIPPLVCSTPPPLDQCEDDKDSEDFDSQYNLSQEDDDDNYNYGDISTLNYSHKSPEKHHSPSAATHTSKTQHELSQNGITDVVHGISSVESVETEPSEKEINIEDLHYLNLNEQPSEQYTIDDQIDVLKGEREISSFNISDTNSESKIPSISLEDIADEDNLSCNASTTLVWRSLGADVDYINEPPNSSDELVKNESKDVRPTDSNIEIDTGTKVEKQSKVIEFSNTDRIDEHTDKTLKDSVTSATVITEDKNVEAVVLPEKPEVQVTDQQDDDFDDFDDFRSATISNNPTTIINSCDNPWGSSTEATSDDFGDFKATFTQEEQEDRKEFSEILATHSKESNEIKESVEDSDDFGDFADFKSSGKGSDFGNFHEFKSSEKVSEEPEEYHEIKKVLDLHDKESLDQLTERLNKIYEKIFPEKIAEPQEELVDDLESKLGQVYENLKQVHERQPYMIQWNGSIAQSYLLKALHIDTRNIIPPPKWLRDKPKFAANLDDTPLEPQKPTLSRTEAQYEPAPKTTWTDPFSSEGQECSYAEALLLDLENIMATLDQMASQQPTLNLSEFLSQAGDVAASSSSDHPPIKISPADLDALEASTSSNPDNIYSNTLTPQPVRQINLPDTHIFTPTDSETPKSQTIHYDSPALLLPSPTIASASLPEEETGPSTSFDTGDEYWEFQDFQGPTSYATPSASDYMDPQPSTSVCAQPPATERLGSQSSVSGCVPQLDPQPSISGLSTSSATFGTDVLQPIKVDTTVPTLNWPEPGEVKETFDDFSDFISTPVWSSNPESQEATESAPSKSKIVPERIPAPVKGESQIPAAAIASDFDEEFDNFQSALPPKNLSSEATYKSLDIINMVPQPDLKNTSTPVYVAPISNQKSDVISFPTTAGSSKPANVPGNPVVRSNVTKVDPIKGSSLQPQPIRPLTPTILKPVPANKAVNSTQNAGQILHPLSLESYSQINWPNPGIDLQDLSRFNPVETLNCLKSDLSTNPSSKGGSPAHSKPTTAKKQQPEDDWGEFVSSKPKPQQPQAFADDDEWSDFVCNPNVNPQSGLNTISFNVHANRNAQKSALQSQLPNAQKPVDIPTLNYITPKTNKRKSTNDKHFQNL